MVATVSKTRSASHHRCWAQVRARRVPAPWCTLPVALAGILALCACGSDDDTAGAGATGGGASGAAGGGGSGAAAGSTPTGGGTGGATGGSGGAGGGVGEPEQLVVLDVEYEHNTTTMAFSFFEVPTHVPDDLTSPVDYAGGHIHQRVIVQTKPSTMDVSYQMCFFQDQHTSDKHACTSYLHFSDLGEVTGDEPMSDLWQYNVIEWNRALLDLMLVVKDGSGHPVDTRYGFDGQWAGSPDLGLYYPMQVRYTGVIVPVGATFEGFPP